MNLSNSTDLELLAELRHMIAAKKIQRARLDRILARAEAAAAAITHRLEIAGGNIVALRSPPKIDAGGS